MSKSSPGTPARIRPHLRDVNRWRSWADARKDEAIQLAQDQLDACRSCRECRHEVAITERICPNCGVSDPVRVPMALSTMLAVAVVAALCALTWML